MIKDFIARIFKKPKVKQSDAQKAAERLKVLFISDPYIPLENADDINILCRYAQESVHINDIKSMLGDMVIQREFYINNGRGMRAQGLNDAIKIVERYPGMLSKLEGLYGLSEND